MELVTAKFKQTEAGLIPSDWEMKKLGEVSDIKTGPFGSSLHERDYVNDGTPIITVEHLSELGIVHNNMPMVSEFDRKRLSAYSMQTNDIVFSRVGSVDRNSMVGEKENGWLFSGRLLRIRINSKTVLPKFVNYHFQQETFKQRIRSVAVGQTMASLNTQILKGIDIVLPPTKTEQTAIATALSDADALISGLEKLIAKKRMIKQAAMQQLLQPKEGWGEISIFQLADGKKELFDDGDWIESEHITDKGIRLIQTGNIGVGKFIEKENQKFIYENSFYILGCKLLKVGDLLICRLAEPAGRACVLPFIGEEKVITSVDVTIFRPRAEVVNRQFLNQIFSTSNWFKSISDLCGGTTHKRISRGALGRIKILLPKLEDQSRIATILSDMDAEISALETKLEKYKKVKLGMMQNLLTGKIRLV